MTLRQGLVEVEPAQHPVVVEVEPDRELGTEPWLHGRGHVAWPALVVPEVRRRDHLRISQRVDARSLTAASAIERSTSSRVCDWLMVRAAVAMARPAPLRAFMPVSQRAWEVIGTQRGFTGS